MRLRGRVLQAAQDGASGQGGDQEVSNQRTVMETFERSIDYRNEVLEKVNAIEAKVDDAEEKHRNKIDTHAKEQRDKLDPDDISGFRSNATRRRGGTT